MVSKKSLLKHRRLHAWIAALALGMLLAMASLAVGVRLVYASRVLPGVTIGETEFGGLNQDRAEAKLRELSSQLATFVIETPKQTFRVSAETLGAEILIDETVRELLSIGKTGDYPDQLLQSFASLFQPTDQAAKFIVDEAAVGREVERIAKAIDKPERDIRLVLKKDKPASPAGGLELLTDTRPGERIDQAELRLELQTRLATLNAAPIRVEPKPITPQVQIVRAQEALELGNLMVAPLKFSGGGEELTLQPKELWEIVDSFPEEGGLALEINETRLEQLVRQVARRINAEPIDARIQIQAGRAVVFTPARSGKTLDQAEAEAALRSRLEQRRNRFISDTAVELRLAVTEPKITTESINDLGIKELIGKGTTSFTGSPNNRIHNLTNGTRFLSGVIIAPGDVFSVVERLGSVDDTTGYLPELVIKENRTIPEFGGGLCQVSTTLFRAVVNTGLPILERQNHSYRVSYYEPPIGLDATVYLPRPDLKFRNDTPAHILVQGYTSGSKLTFEIYGTKDGRTTEIRGPFVSNRIPPPPAVYHETPDLPAGTTKQIEKPHQGASAVAYYTVSRGGEVIHKQTFASKYKPWPARFLVGVGQTTPPPTSPPSEPVVAPLTPTESPQPAPTSAAQPLPSPATEPAPTQPTTSETPTGQ